MDGVLLIGISFPPAVAPKFLGMDIVKSKIKEGDGGRSSIILRALENLQNKKRGIEESTDLLLFIYTVDSLNPCS